MHTKTWVGTTLLLLAILGFAGGCAGSGPSRPESDSGQPLALDDPERYLPPRLSGLRVGNLPPTLNDDVAAESEVYGLAEWVRSFQGATMVAGAGDTARGFVSVVVRGAEDPELARRVAFFGSGSGSTEAAATVDVAGQTVETGRVANADGTFPYAVWSPPETSITVAITARGDESLSGFDALSAMEELIDWSTQ